MATVLSIHDRRILTAVNSGASSLSFVGSGFIVLCYSLFKELCKLSFNTFPSLTCFAVSLTWSENSQKVSLSCSWLHHAFLLPLDYYYCFFSSSNSTAVRHKTDVEDLEAIFHLFVWGTSLVMTVIRSIGNDHTYLGAWCWAAQTGRTEKAVNFITFYVPPWGASLQRFYILSSDTHVEQCHPFGMSDRAYQFDSRTDTKALNRWGYYPLILIGSWAFGTINRIHDFIEPGYKIFWLSFLDVGTAALNWPFQLDSIWFECFSKAGNL